MVRAVLDGRKTQACKTVNPQPIVRAGQGEVLPINMIAHCPYGKSGDFLWVRENFCTLSAEHMTAVKPNKGQGQIVRYQADDPFPDRSSEERGYRWRQAIHLPRWLSRIKLEVLDVRVERLHNFSDADCIAQGIIEVGPSESPFATPLFINPSDPNTYPSAKSAYKSLWEATNGHASWHTNPHVWVINFRRVA